MTDDDKKKVIAFLASDASMLEAFASAQHDPAIPHIRGIIDRKSRLAEIIRRSIAELDQMTAEQLENFKPPTPPDPAEIAAVQQRAAASRTASIETETRKAVAEILKKEFGIDYDPSKKSAQDVTHIAMVLDPAKAQKFTGGVG